VPFLVIEKVMVSEETFQTSQFVRTVVELLNQIAQLLFRMESNGEMTLKFVIELLRRTQKNVNMDLDDKTFFYTNTLNICVKLFEKFGSEVETMVEEALLLLIVHWSG
jgi:hypothetical protein